MSFIILLQAITAILLIFSILLQHRASGLSATFGGGGTTYVQRRGAEKLLFQVSVGISIVFFGLAILQWYL